MNTELNLPKKCEHGRQKSKCKDCGGSQICPHRNWRQYCKDCGGASICPHGRRRYECKECTDPIDVTIRQWISHCRSSDKKYGRLDADHFIDTDFLRGLVEDDDCCYYEDCQKKLQYTSYSDDLATIERLDNSKGHTKSNCVLACKKCNIMKKSNNFVSEV